MRKRDAIVFAFGYLAYIAFIILLPNLLRRIFPKRKKRGNQ